MGNRKSGAKSKPAAQKPAGETTQNQSVAGAGGAEKKSGSAAAVGPEVLDNNKRLHFLENQNLSLAQALEAVDDFGPLEGEDPVDGAIRLIDELIAKRETSASTSLPQIDRLTQFLVKHPAFTPKEGGEMTDDGIIRLVGQLEEKGDVATQALAGLALYVATNDFRVGDRTFLGADFDRGAFTIQDILMAAQVELATEGPPAPSLPEYADVAAAEVAVAGDLAPDAPMLVLCSDGESFIGSIPGLSVGIGDGLDLTGRRALLARPIACPSAAPPATVSEVWLIGFKPGSFDGEAGKLAAVKCQLAAGLRVGGGAQAVIPSGHLIF
jgi:hypothetical protein